MSKNTSTEADSYCIQYLGTDKGWWFERTDDLPRIIFQVSGSARYTAGNKTFQLKAGHVLVAEGVLTGRGDSPFIEVRIPSMVFNEARNLLGQQRKGQQEHGSHTVRIAARDLSALEDILVKLTREQEFSLPGQSLSIRALLLELLVFLHRARHKSLPSWEHYTTLGTLLERRNVQRVIHHAYEHCEAPWTIAALVRMAGVNRTTFCHLHKRLTGTSPMRLIIKARIEKAKELLSKSSYSLEYISCAVGFANLQTFFRAFRRLTATTPEAFRRAARERSNRSGAS